MEVLHVSLQQLPAMQTWPLVQQALPQVKVGSLTVARWHRRKARHREVWKKSGPPWIYDIDQELILSNNSIQQEVTMLEKLSQSFQ